MEASIMANAIHSVSRVEQAAPAAQPARPANPAPKKASAPEVKDSVQISAQAKAAS
jgi:chitodextrinase